MRIKLIFLSLLLFITSCFYTPEDEFVNSGIIEPDLTNFSISVSQNDDTIYIYESTEVVFDIFDGTNPRSIVDATLIFGGNRARLDISNNRITWDAFPLGSEENFTLITLEVIMESNSNSLADRLGSEFIQLTANWILHSDPAPPPAISISSAQVENGILTVRWEEPDKLNFRNYTFHTEYRNLDGETIRNERSIQYGLGSDLIFEDVNFVSGEVDYWVTMVGEIFQETGPKTTFRLDPIDLEYELGPDQTLTLNWATIPIYAHNMSASIDIAKREFIDVTNLQSTSVDTDFVIDPVTKYTVTFTITGLNEDYGFEHIETLLIEPEGGGFDSDLFEIIYHQPTNSYLVTYRDGSTSIIRKLDATTFELVDELRLDLPKLVTRLTSSQDGQYVYAYSQDVNLMARIDPTTMTLLNQVEIQNILGQAPTCCVGDITISNNNKAVIRWAESFQNRNDRFNIIDLSDNMVEFTDNDCFLELSPDGKYALTGSTIMDYDGTSWSSTLTLNDNEDICSYNQFTLLQNGDTYYALRAFSPTAPFEEMSIYSWTITTTDGSGLNASKVLPPSSLVYRNYDPTSGYAAFQDANNFYIYDFTTGDLKYSTQINSSGSKFFWNNTLISTDGTYVPIDIN